MSGLVKSVVQFLGGNGRIFGGGGNDLAAASCSSSQDVKYLTHQDASEEKTITREQSLMVDEQKGQESHKSARFLGSLKDALAAAGRDETGGVAASASSEQKGGVVPPPLKTVAAAPVGAVVTPAPAAKSAQEAAREARASTGSPPDKPVTSDTSPTTHVVKPQKTSREESPARTQLVRGKRSVERGTFNSDPVVGWLVVVGGPGIGQFRPIFEGNNAIGRSANQRIPLDFGDDSISSEEQAFIRYDSSDRSFLFVPNLAKTNVVSVNNNRPTGAVELAQMDVIQMGRSQIVFVPFCGTDFDWAELIDKA